MTVNLPNESQRKLKDSDSKNSPKVGGIAKFLVKVQKRRSHVLDPERQSSREPSGADHVLNMAMHAMQEGMTSLAPMPALAGMPVDTQPANGPVMLQKRPFDNVRNSHRNRSSTDDRCRYCMSSK